MQADTKKPNTILRQQRLLKGWSQQRVVDELLTLFRKEDQSDPGINAETISKWERGERKPKAFYQEKLCLLFGKSAQDLGFLDMPGNAPEEPENQGIQPAFSSPAAISSPIDMPWEMEEASAEYMLGERLVASAGDLIPLFDAGWSREAILESLQVILRGVQAIPCLTRRTLLQLGATAIVRGVAAPTHENVSAGEREQLCTALSESIIAGWKLFNVASIAQVLAVGQALLMLVKQHHSILYPSVRPIYYSAIYRLIGAAYFFQSRYNEAMEAQKRAYLAALESGDVWNMSESLNWQGGVLKAYGNQEESIQATQAALRLLQGHDDPLILAARARLFAHWAESAALLHERHVMEEKLAASSDLLSHFEGNEEFDYGVWLQYQGTCALYIGDAASADTYLEQALHKLKPNWIHQRASTALLQTQARLALKEREGVIASAHKASPLVTAVDSPLMYQGMLSLVQKSVVTFPHHTEMKELLEKVQHLIPGSLVQTRPRYLGGDA